MLLRVSGGPYSSIGHSLDLLSRVGLSPGIFCIATPSSHCTETPTKFAFAFDFLNSSQYLEPLFHITSANYHFKFDKLTQWPAQL